MFRNVFGLFSLLLFVVLPQDSIRSQERSSSNNPAAPIQSAWPKNRFTGAQATRQYNSFWGFDPLDWSVDMVELPANSYLLQDQYLVYIPAFRLSRFQVTQQFYHSVMRLPRPETAELHKPMVGVSWFDAVRFTNELSRRAGLESAYRIRELHFQVRENNQSNIKRYYEVEWLRDSNGFRLPTEAEWEYAARGGARGRRFLYSGSNTAENVAWYDGNTGQLRPIGQKEPNDIGLYDMSGNAWDWLWDRYIQLQHSRLAENRWANNKEAKLRAVVPIGGPSDLDINMRSPEAKAKLIWQGPTVYEGRLHPMFPSVKSASATADLAMMESQQDVELRVCRGGGWNFAKLYSETLQRSPCIAQADYYVSVSFRLARNVANADEQE